MKHGKKRGSNLQYNANIFKDFSRLVSVFTDYSGNFSEGKYNRFFKKAFRWRIKRFFRRARAFSVKLIYHIQSIEKGKNQVSRYFLDLTVLLCSGLNTELRRSMIDNDRATVDIKSANIEVILADMEHLTKVMNMHGKKETFMAPCDFTLLYNVLDYVSSSFDWERRSFADLAIFEAKHHKTTKKDSKQISREQRQIERGRAVYPGARHVLDRVFRKPTYLSEDALNKLKKEKIFVVDEVFSLELKTNETIKSNDSLWIMDFIEEIICGAITPSIFRGVKVGFLDNLMNNQIHLFIHANKSKFKDHMRSLPFVTKITMDSNPYNGHVYFKSNKGEGRISIANFIQAKYSIENLKLALKEAL